MAGISGLTDWISKNRLILFSLALILHLAFLVIALVRHSCLTDDSIQYLTLSENLLNGNGFSQSYISPFVPDLQRVPGYPIFLAMTGNVLTIVLILQHILVFATAFFLKKIAGSNGNGSKGDTVALIYLLMPYPAVFASMILSETLFIFLLVLAFYFLFKYHKGQKLQSLLFFLVGISISAFVRPVSLPVLAIIFLSILIYIVRKPSKKIAALGVLFVVPMIIIGPWIWRNHELSERWVFNSMGDMGMIHGRLGGLEAYRNDRGQHEHEFYMAGDSIAALEVGLGNVRTYYSEKQNHETELYDPEISGITVGFFMEHPVDAMVFQLKSVGQMLIGTGKGWVTLVTGSAAAGWAAGIWQLVLNLVMFAGFVYSIFKFRSWEKYQYWLFLGIVVIYIVSAAAWSDGRYRVVADPLMLLLFFGLTKKVLNH